MSSYKDFAIKREYIFITITALLIFLSMATTLGDMGLVGSYGARFAEMNIRYFGLLAHLYLLMLLYPLYRLYREPRFSWRRLELIVANVLLFFSLLVFQALLLDVEIKGRVGLATLEALRPLIGLFGVWILILTGFSLSFMIIFNPNIDELYRKILSNVTYIKENITSVFTPKKKVETSEKIVEEKNEKHDVVLDEYLLEEQEKLQEEHQNSAIPEPIAYREDNYARLVRLIKNPAKSEVDKHPEPTSSVEITERLLRQGDISPASIAPIRSISESVNHHNASVSDSVASAQASQPVEQIHVNSEPLAIPCDEADMSAPEPREIAVCESVATIEESNIIESEPKNIIYDDCKKEHASEAIFDAPSIKEVLTKEEVHADLHVKSESEVARVKVLSKVEEVETGADVQSPVIDRLPHVGSGAIFNSGESPVIIKELEENTALLSALEFGETSKPKDFKLPSLDFLALPSGQRVEIDEVEIDRKIQDLLGKLKMFKIEGDVARTYSGPIVTTFEFRPAPSVKVSRILTLEDDLAMALRAKTIRIQAPVPGKDVVGIEIPNNVVETIYLREILESELFQKSTSPLTLALGKDIVGKPFITDLKKLPHLLIAGTTGSGKSVGINAMILSLLYKNSPDDLKLIMIDPKMLEFSIYNDIPHLLTPVITQPKKAIVALSNTVSEMERRYEMMSKAKVKNIENYNEKATREGFERFPYIVVIIDELADLMMTGGKDVEYSIARLAQMARASGIHLIVATQRPSVDIVTGLIKANLPSRISYKVGQKIDSKVILDSFGAESLLGRGDMLFTPPGSSGVVRLHAPWSTEEEIENIVEYLKAQRVAEYDESFLGEDDDSQGFVKGGSSSDDSGDELYEEAKRVILNDKKTSISYIQRRLGIGYNKAATIIEQMERRGFLSTPNSKGNREIIG
ncbi:MAG: DNA translocase FtsK [Wolinella sp.]